MAQCNFTEMINDIHGLKMKLRYQHETFQPLFGFKNQAMGNSLGKLPEARARIPFPLPLLGILPKRLPDGRVGSFKILVVPLGKDRERAGAKFPHIFREWLAVFRH
ncbi:hypothetical protein D1872_259440 [compost metagenome]